MDLPEEPEGYDLVYPFVCVESHGGPWDDQAFVAGMQAGRLDHALAAAAAVGIDSARFTIFNDLVKQVELIGMHRGFAHIRARETEAEGWTFVEFSTQPFTEI